MLIGTLVVIGLILFVVFTVLFVYAFIDAVRRL